jgi:hypothetical protein
MVEMDKALGQTPTSTGWLGRFARSAPDPDKRRRRTRPPEVISLQSFQAIFLGKDRPVTKAEHSMLLNLFRIFDLDRSGSLDFFEFASGLSKCCLDSDNERLTRGFAVLSHNSS